jgi:hypothetical protein
VVHPKVTISLDHAAAGSLTAAPYFELFISCVAFLMLIHGRAFEFDPQFLEDFLEEAFGFRFCTFIYHSSKLRRDCTGKSSVVDFFVRNKAKYQNPFYSPVKGVLIMVRFLL